MTNDGPDDLDRLIDRALSSYTSREPMSGIECRVMSRIRAPRSRFPFAWPVLATPALGLLVLAVVGVWREPAPAPPRQVELTRAQTVPQEVPKKHRNSHRVARMPKKPVFPSPEPITPQERALIAFVEHYPAEAQKVFVALQKSEEPLKIDPIQIEPLGKEAMPYGIQKEEDRDP